MRLPVVLIPLTSSEHDNGYPGPRPISIKLVKALSIGPFRWSQVYRAAVNQWSQPPKGIPSQVVVKLYVRSSVDRNLPHDYRDAEHLGDDAMGSQATMLAKESLAYKRLGECPVTPKWYGTYEFVLPTGEQCSGVVIEYLEGISLYDEAAKWPCCQPVPNRNTLFKERISAAADSLDELHSHRVAHRDLSSNNIIVLSDPKERFPIRFVDFGSALVIRASKMQTERARMYLASDRLELIYVLASVLNFDLPEEARPLLREMPPKASIRKLMNTWNVKPTLAEERALHIAEWMEWGMSEEEAKEDAEEYIL